MGNEHPTAISPATQETNCTIGGCLDSSIQDSFFNSRFSDVTIVTAAQKFELHKLVICGQSKYFSRLFNNNWKETAENIISLEDDDPTAIHAMLLFMYGFDYERICSERCANSPLSFHVRVYQVGDKYDVPKLRDYARRKFASAIRTCWETDDFPVAISDAYSTTPPADNGLLDFIVIASVDHLDKLLENDYFNEVLKETPGFAVDIVRSGRLSAHSLIYRCPDCTGVWRLQLPNSKIKAHVFCPSCGRDNNRYSWRCYVTKDSEE